MGEHKHPVTDTDAFFEINAVTRDIASVSGKSALIQGDHNSERFTFELSARHIENHDMSQCNVVQIHFINIDSATKAQSVGVYEVNDMKVSPEDENKVILSWLISNNATRYAGSLNFIIKFKCVSDDGKVDYVWNSGIYENIRISNGIDNGEAIENEYPDILAEWEARIKALEDGGAGGSVSEEQIAQAVEDYFAEHPNSGGNVAQGLTAEQIAALDGMFKVCAFTKADVSAEYNAFKTAFGIEDSGEEEPDVPVIPPDEPDEPDVPEVTLTGISATYSGGDVAVGTAVTDLTGIVVTAHYSDGSTETVTGYTLSGTIAEGSNTVTVSYGGKTTTFTVTGVAESGGGDSGDSGEYETVNILDVATFKEGYCFKGTSGTGTHWNKELYTISDVKAGDVLMLYNAHNEGVNTSEFFGALNADGTYVNLSSEIVDHGNNNYTYRESEWTATKDYPEVYWSPTKGTVAKVMAEYNAPQPTWTRKKVE